jgi:N utilization substance protein B
MNTSSRHLAREQVLKALYAEEIGEVDAAALLERLLADEGLSEKHAEFGRNLLTLAQKAREEATRTIASLAENWQLERLATIDRIIMCLAITEFREMPDVPIKVVLNEAIELAKTFSTSQSSSFINGILDRFIRQLESKPGN